MKTFTFACLAAIGLACNPQNEKCTIGDVDFKSIGKIHYRTCSYLDMGNWGGEDFLLISEFNGAPWRSGSVAIVPGIKDAVADRKVDTLDPVTLDPRPYKFENPNRATVVPDAVFPGHNVVLVPDGFVIPGHRNGGIYLLVQDPDDITKTTKTLQITPKDEQYWYHTGHWYDMNDDGLLDLLIARTNSEVGGGELMWFQQPAGGLGLEDENSWTRWLITSGPDVGTTVEDIGSNELLVWAPIFFSEQVGVYKVSTAVSTPGELLDSRIFDDNDIALGGYEPKRAYSLTVVDLNGDGNKQLLFNNWEQDENVNGIWAYEVPADPFNDAFVKYPISLGFKMSWKYWLTGISGPGYPFVFYPDNDTNSRAHILADGHGSDALYLLTPVGDASNYEYQRDTVVSVGAVVPFVVQADFDEDGYNEVYMANYQGGYVEVFKTEPASNYPLS